MPRVCPKCRKLTADSETFCGVCGARTVDPLTWQHMRTFTTPEVPPVHAREPRTDQPPDYLMKVGLGGLLAFFVFFLVYLAAYLTFIT